MDLWLCPKKERDREIDTDRPRQGGRGKERDRERYRQTDRQTDRQRGRERKKERERRKRERRKRSRLFVTQYAFVNLILSSFVLMGKINELCIDTVAVKKQKPIYHYIRQICVDYTDKTPPSRPQ